MKAADHRRIFPRRNLLPRTVAAEKALAVWPLGKLEAASPTNSPEAVALGAKGLGRKKASLKAATVAMEMARPRARR